MRRTKTYNVRVTEAPNGTMTIDYALNLIKVNQHKKFWNPVNKREFARSLRRHASKGQLVTK